MGSDWGNLKGSRTSPYEFEAKMKGDAGPYNLKLVIETDRWLYDENGKETPDSQNADSKKEVLTRIGVGPLDPPPPK